MDVDAENPAGTGFDESDLRALAAGDLPPRIRRRLDAQRGRGSWTSDFSVDELAAVRSVGFSPLSQVMGSSVYQVGWAGAGGCGAYFSAYEMTPYVQALQQARGLALRRLALEAAELGADGVVGLRFNVRWLDLGGSGMSGQSAGQYEFSAIGTAIRGRPPAGAPHRTFLSALTGQQFAKLLRAGYVPCDLVMGITAIYVHSNWRMQMQQSSWINQEMGDYTNAMMAARHQAMGRLREAVLKTGADGAVGSDVSVQVKGVRCPYQEGVEDHVIEFFAMGTAVSRFQEEVGAVKTVKRLDDAPPAPIAGRGKMGGA
ncbi:MAG: heavy metal-binding domain-containing protein [Candidatus Dormibacteraceae bacterium]